jgi:protein-L-isoaspartate(D-aspartate) O-methyltransferase
VTDTYRHKGMRRKLIETLRRKGIRDERVLEAMEKLPRHFFLDKAFEERAYEDNPFPIGNEQTISQPYTVAFQTELLDVQKRMKVLEIGTGSGYQAAVIALMGGRVYTIERFEALHRKAKSLLETIGLRNIRCFYRDGNKGLPEFAPFDRIIVTAGAVEVPDTLRQQLAIGGILVIPVGVEVQHMLRIRRISVSEFVTEDTGDFKFVPFLPGTEPGR